MAGMPPAHQSASVSALGLWSWPDWWEEIEAGCLARALEALYRFDPARGVPAAALLHKQVRYGLSDCYRQDSRFAAHCHSDSVAIPEPVLPHGLQGQKI
jgi:hypothetical protein